MVVIGQNTKGRRSLGVLGLDFGFIDEHDWQAVPNRINAMALPTLQALGTLAVLEFRLASWADQHFEKVFG
jgi:hypothetical protein